MKLNDQHELGTAADTLAEPQQECTKRLLEGTPSVPDFSVSVPQETGHPVPGQ